MGFEDRDAAAGELWKLTYLLFRGRVFVFRGRRENKNFKNFKKLTVFVLYLFLSSSIP